MHINLYEVKLNENGLPMQMSSKVHIQFGSNSMQKQPLLNEEKRVSFIEFPFSLAHGPDPLFMEIEIFNLMKWDIFS